MQLKLKGIFSPLYRQNKNAGNSFKYTSVYVEGRENTRGYNGSRAKNSPYSSQRRQSILICFTAEFHWNMQ